MSTFDGTRVVLDDVVYCDSKDYKDSMLRRNMTYSITVSLMVSREIARTPGL